jgi:flavin-dependent dehydrogenase
MERDGITHSVTRGGFISPFGYACINTDGAAYGSVSGCRTYAIKRELADQYLVQAAAKNGASLFENVEVIATRFIPLEVTSDRDDEEKIQRGDTDADGYWSVTTKNTVTLEERTYTTRMVLVCDGSTSYTAQRLQLVPKTALPEAECSTGYIANHTWQSADGVMLFNRAVLPGYSALFRHANGDVYLGMYFECCFCISMICSFVDHLLLSEFQLLLLFLNLGTYILPGGKATSRCIPQFETELAERHPYVHDALGHGLEYSKRRTVAPIRLGGVPRCYAKQLLLVGDAAGHVSGSR